MFGLFLFLLTTVASAGDFETASAAYQEGNYLKARAMFEQLAQEGDVKAQVKFAQMLDKGQGGAKSYKKAILWYRQAAVRSYPEAQYYMGVKYINGHGVPKNEIVAYAWFAVALDNGYAKAAQPLKVLNTTMESAARQQALQLAGGPLAAITHMTPQTQEAKPNTADTENSRSDSSRKSRRSRY